MQPIPGLSVHHAPSAARWLLNVACHPETSVWLMENPLRFAAFFAALKPKVSLPANILAALPKDSEGMQVHGRQELMDTWKKSGDMPLHGRVSPSYLEAFWEGTQLATWVQTNQAAWAEALRSLVAQFSAPDEETGQTLSREALATQESPAIVSTPPAQGRRDPLAMFHLNIDILLRLLPALTRHEQRIIELSFVLAEDEPCRMFFDMMGENPRNQHELMAVALDIPQEELERVVKEDGDLAALHLVPFEPSTRRIMPLPPFWHHWLGSLHKSGDDAMKRFLVPLRREKNAGALGRLSPDDTAMVRRILESGEDRTGTNVLLYGAKSIDKTGWVAELADQMKRTAYTLAPNVPDPVKASVCQVAQRLLANIDKTGILVLPQADTILTRTQRGMRQFLFLSISMEDESPDVAHERALIDNNPVPTIWLVHSADRLSENNIGRFLYTCEMKAASRAERRVEIASSLALLNLSDTFLTELAQHTRVSEQQLESAGELARRFFGYPFSSDAQAVEAREHLVRQAIEQSQKALDRRQREDLRQSVTQYSLDLLNVEGAFTVPQILSSLKRQPQASLCFYGIPGTGKTQLAEHMAVVLDKPLLIKRASDLLSKYIGDNEKNIKEMFDEARDEDAVLLLDEADSFLRDRAMARHSWEVTMVNELLQGMERHRGVFICTTNLYSCLDAASLRRFTFKLNFQALTETQRWTMFLNESGADESSFAADEAERLKMELTLIRDLAPGDFATVQRQVRLLGQPLDAYGWLTALRNEARAKMREAELALPKSDRS